MRSQAQVLPHYVPVQIEEGRTQRKLRALYDLKAGWHYGEGKQLSSTAIDVAQRLYNSAASMGLATSDVFPVINGDVLLTIYLDETALEFTAHSDGSVTFYCEANDEDSDETVMTVANAKRVLTEHAPAPWRSSDSSVEPTTIASSSDFSLLLSQNTTVESRWFRFPALSHSANHSASTYVHITLPL